MYVASLFFVWLIALGAALSGSAAGPIQVRIDPPIVSPDGSRYRVHVTQAGAPIFIVPAEQTQSVTLIVNGRVVQKIDANTQIRQQPLGRALDTLELSGVGPADRVSIVTVGSATALRVVSNFELLDAALHTGIYTGVHFAFLVLIASMRRCNVPTPTRTG